MTENTVDIVRLEAVALGKYTGKIYGANEVIGNVCCDDLCWSVFPLHVIIFFSKHRFPNRNLIISSRRHSAFVGIAFCVLYAWIRSALQMMMIAFCPSFIFRLFAKILFLDMLFYEMGNAVLVSLWWCSVICKVELLCEIRCILLLKSMHSGWPHE